MITIRRATRRDIPQLSKLLDEYYNVFMKKTLGREIQKFEALRSSRAKIRTDLKEYFGKSKYAIFVAESQKLLLGCLIGEIFEHKSRLIKRGGYIINWYVFEKSRKSGAGKKLWNAFVKHCKTEECEYLVLDVHWDNKTAVKFYHDMGFTDSVMTMKKVLKK